MKKLNDIKMAGKLWMLVALAVVGTIVTVAVGLQSLRTTLVEDRRAMVRNIVEEAASVARHYADKVDAGELTESKAKQRAISALNAIRFQGGNNYIFITDFDAKVVDHPIKPDLNGRDLWDFTDPEGKPLFQHLSRAAQAGGGFVPYLWPKPGSEQPQPKISYAAGLDDWKWVIGAGVYVEDINSTFWAEAARLSGIVVAQLMVLVVIALVIKQRTAPPIMALAAEMQALERGERAITISGTDRGDEIGEMSRAVDGFKDSLIEADRLAAEEEKERRSREERAQRVGKLATDFSEKMRTIVETVSGASTELESTAKSMSATAEKATQQASSVASSAEQTSSNVQTVSSAAEELTNSIHEISSQVQHASTIADRAAESVDAAENQVRGLANATSQIGDVVELIQNIADKTNLLALNATIEAARAGEAGKGFSVVANEVKGLANQTSKATDQIRHQIGQVQSESNQAVDAIHQIGGVVKEVKEVAASIASAMEQQNAATGEIAQNVEQAAAGTQTVTTDIGDVKDAAGSANTSSKDVLEKAHGLSANAKNLDNEVADFLREMRTVSG